MQAKLQKLRDTIRAAAPGATETISYAIPTFRVGSAYLVHFAGRKKHIAVYPLPAGPPDLLAALAPFREAKGTLRFPLDRPIPLDLVTGMVAARYAELRRRDA